MMIMARFQFMQPPTVCTQFYMLADKALHIQCTDG